MATLKTRSLVEEKAKWKWDDDDVILDHIRHWTLEATAMGFSKFTVTYKTVIGTYACWVIK